MRFVPLSEAEDKSTPLRFVPLEQAQEKPAPARPAVNLGQEPPPGGLSGEFAGFADVFAPPVERQESVLQGRPMREPAIARDKLLDPTFVDTIKQNFDQMDPGQRQATLAQMAKRTDVYGRAAKVLTEHYKEVDAARTGAAATVLARPRTEEVSYLGEMAKGAKSNLEYGLPSMGIQLALQGSASAMVARQGQLSLMDRIDQGEFETLRDLKNDPQYQALREEGNDGFVNSYFANRSNPNVGARLRNKTQEEMTALVSDTAGHIKTLNQYARQNKDKYGPAAEKFTDLDWSDPRVVEDFKNWLGFNMGAGAVQMAPIMLAAVVTKRPGLLATSASMGVSEAVANRLKFIQGQVKDLPPEQQGQAIAKYIADSGDANLITGLVAGSFDLLLGPAAKAAKGSLSQEVGKLVAAKKAVKELPKDIGGEAVTGALQQATQIAAAKQLQEEGRRITPENIRDIIDSAAAEAAGAPFGTAVNVAMAAATAPSAPPGAPIPPARPRQPVAPAVPPAPPAARVEPQLQPGQLPAPAGERQEPTLTFTPLQEAEEDVVPGMPTGAELEEEAAAPAAPGNQPRVGDSFDAAGWTEQENKIHAKTGKPVLTEGRVRYKKTDDRGFEHTVVVKDGEVSTSNSKSPVIELTNSVLDFDAPVSGRVHVQNLFSQGLTLTFIPEGASGAGAIKMSPRAVQQYKDGVPIEQIAELEFSDAGGIMPDGSRTPHTTVGKLVSAQPKAPAAPPAAPAAPPAAPVKPTIAAAALPETPTVPPPTKPREFEPRAEQQAVGGLPIQEVPLSDLKLSKDVPQFKIGASDKGVVEPLGGKFERTGVAPIQVWQRLDGSLEIISGRHRFDLAQRSGEKTIPAQIHREADGFDAIQAATLDAELNIRDGQGKVKDYVNYFKASGIDRQEAESRGLLARATGKRSYTIANQGSEELLAAVRSDQIGDEAAYYIALNAPKDSRLQAVGLNAINDGKSMNTAINMMQAVKALASEQDTTTDMFGFDDSAIREAEEMAKIAARKQRDIQARLSAISGAAKNPAVARAEGIDIKDPEAVNKRIDELRQTKAAWENWSTSPQLIAEIRAERGTAAPTLAPVEPVITAQTEEELRQKAEQEAAATKREADERRKAEEKAKADEERDEFVLTGSDRAADEAAARGQEDLFAAPAEAPTILPAKKKPKEPEVVEAEPESFGVGPGGEKIPAPETAKDIIDKYLRKVRAEKTTEAYEDYEGKNIRTVTSEWKGTISRKDFDALAGESEVTQLKRGNKYTISLYDTPTTSTILAFTARGLTPTQQRVEVVMQLQTSTVVKPEAVEPGSVPDENDPGFLGASDEEVKEVAGAFKGAKETQKDEANTRVFDAPEKQDIVRIEDKARKSEVLTIAEAKKRIAEWKRNAQAQGETSANSDKVVLSLFDATGEWSKPWEEAGYQVFRFDIQTDPEMGDVTKFSAEFFNELYGAFDGQDVYAVLAACPCTDFASSGARHFAAKDESGKTVESVELVYQTLRTIEYFKPSIWAIENPVGRIEKLTGLPPWRMSFNPNHFGDPYTKKTLLWGRFNADLPVAPVVPTEGSKMHRMYGGKSQETKNARSVTPEGFAYAFFQANNAVDNPVMAVSNKYDMMDPAVIKQAVDAGLTDKEIAAAVDDAYYDQDYAQANLDLKKAIAAKKPKGAAVMGERMVNAADRFRKAAMNQFKLTQEQADAAMGKLLKEKVLILDSVTGQFELKDGRFWDRDVLLKAAGEKPAEEKKPEVSEQEKENKENAEVHAKELGGEIVWQKGEYALIRGYSAATGDPVYAGTMGSRRASVDIEAFTGNQIPEDIKQEMIAAKKKAEAEAQEAHEKKPFIKFKDGLAVSEGISPELEGVIRGWKDILKLDVPIYVGTIEDARRNKNKYTGPHRRIGSGTLDANERGSMRRMSDGSYYILFKESTSPTLMLETVAHEMGHLHERLVYEKASPEEKRALADAHTKWLEKQKGKSAQDLVNALRGRATQRQAKMPEDLTAEQLSYYWKSFGEWYADQVSRWAVSGTVPVGVVEKFFKRLGNQLRRFFQVLKNAKYLPDETFVQYIEKVTARPVNLAPDQQDVSDRMVEGGLPADKIDVLQNIEPKNKAEQVGFAFDTKVADEVSRNNPTVAKTLARLNELPGAKKKLPPGRSPELAAAAEQVQAGLMTAKEFDELVNRYKPIPVYFAPLKPATSDQVYNALDSAKREKIDPNISTGYPVGLRLDIPAFNRHGVFVVSIHEKRTPTAPGKVIGYSSVASIKDVTFGVGNQKAALRIAAGEAKDAIQTMEGKYNPITPEQAYQLADDAILSGDWVQVGFDPTRHAYFFDRRTTVPVVAADEVIQIGNMILAKGVTYGKKDEFLYNIGQGDLFGASDAKAEPSKPTLAETKIVKRGRSPEVAEAAEQLRLGKITKAQYEEVVQKYSPVAPYAEPPKPASDKAVVDALDANKRQYANVDIEPGTRVGLRLDIPAWENRKTWVVAIHEPKPRITSPKASAILSYRSVAGLKNVTFGVGDQARSLRIAAGEFKDKLQTMEGEYVDMTPEEAYKRAQKLINDPDYIQIGFNPIRHAYFYDRSTMEPVVKADEVIQIGNMILARGVTYGKKSDFLYNVVPEPSLAEQEDDLIFGAESIRKYQIERYAELRRKIAATLKKVAKGEISIDMQRNLTRMMQESRELQASIKSSAPRRDSAKRFMAKALQEYDDGNISVEVLAVIEQVYQKFPDLLNGLLLSVRKGDGQTAGSFASLSRIVSLFKGTSGTYSPTTVRHELAHSLEQMMTPEQAAVVIQAWTKALARAIKQNPDDLYQKYFNAVLDFIDNPTNATLEAAQAALPSYEMYQFINPSEYWAVNAEKLLGAELGPAWDRFKKAVRKLFEALKHLFGFDNTYAIHKVFDQVMGGKRERITYDALANMVAGVGGEFTTLRNIEDEKELLEKYSRPKTPMLDKSPLKTFLTRQFKNGKEFFIDAVKNPKEAMVGSSNSVVDGLILLRNENVWYGSGLEARDFDRYNGELRTSEGMATASVALDNAIRSGNIGVQVIFQGGIKYDKDSNNFVATDKKLGMKGVYEAEAKIKERLGEQLGTDIVQGYLEAKRSISIMDELYETEAAFEDAKQNLEAMRALKRPPEEIAQAEAEVNDAKSDLDAINKAVSSVNMSEEEMNEFAALDQKHPELREIMDNWTAINQNLLKFWRQVGLLSQGRYERLSSIKDYVPWYRIMNDEEDVHSPLQSTTRTLSNIGREKLFKRGKPMSVVDFRAREGQQDFKIQPSSVVKVKVNGQSVSSDKISVTSSGEVRIDMPLQENDLVVFETNREIENIIDNMTRNVMRMTMNGIRQFAANRIVLEYASRNENGKIMVFPNVDKNKGRFNWIVNGKKVVVEIQDPLVAASIYGMENLNLQMLAPLAAVANFTRRTITLSGVFQIKQVFKDAPTAALVTGVKNPLALIGGVWKGFLTSLTMTDPVVDILKAAGIGGYMSPARTPEAEIKRRLGIMNRNVFDFVIKGLDHIGDAADMAQRVAVYKRVMAETGDETQALYQAANVINFLHHGSAGYAQAIVKTVPFFGAYANATDVLVRALLGGGLKGMKRKKALMRLGITVTMLTSLTLLYCMLAGGDPEYDELDDQTKLRNIIIPGTKIMLPMNTSAAFIFKAVPELIYNRVTREGTNNEYDRKRLHKALAEVAKDTLLGPEPIPAGIKPILEIGINRNFFTGRPIIPEGIKDLEAAEQYTAATSELGKKISAMLAIPGTDNKRVLSPVEADHLIRGIFGTAGAMGQWVSNSIGAMSEVRPEPTARETPITGSFLREEVPRGREDLFYDFRDRVNQKYKTYMKMMDREDYEAADKYIEKHGDVADMYQYVNEVENTLKSINAEIRLVGETKSKEMTPQQRRKEIEDLQREKLEILDDVKDARREAFGTGFGIFSK